MSKLNQLVDIQKKIIVLALIHAYAYFFFLPLITTGKEKH